jgi:hypothetical protein
LGVKTAPGVWLRGRGGLGATTAALCVAGILAADAVLAQTAKDESVLGRPRPEYDPLGLELDEILYRVGLLDRKTVEEKRSPLASFVVHPVTEVEVRAESNVFRTSRSVDTPKSDEIAYLRPALSISSDWNNHAVNLSVSGEIARHLHYQGEDFENFRSLVGGRLDATRELALSLEGRFDKLRELRGTLDDLGPAVPPVTDYVLGIAGGARYMADPLLLHLRGEARKLWFEGGNFTTPLRDRTETVVSLRTGWKFSPGTILFVEPAYNIRDYETKRDSVGLLQGSDGYRVLVGASWDVSGAIFIEMGVGWLRQRFDEPTFDPVSGPAVEGKMLWNLDPLLTLTAALSRRVEETAVVGISGNVVTQAVVGLDYEILDNLIFSARLDFSHQKLLGQGPFGNQGRRDKVWVSSVGFDYRIGNKWFARLSYEDVRRNSNFDQFSFSDQIISLRLGERL